MSCSKEEIVIETSSFQMKTPEEYYGRLPNNVTRDELVDIFAKGLKNMAEHSDECSGDIYNQFYNYANLVDEWIFNWIDHNGEKFFDDLIQRNNDNGEEFITKVKVKVQKLFEQSPPKVKITIKNDIILPNGVNLIPLSNFRSLKTDNYVSLFANSHGWKVCNSVKSNKYYDWYVIKHPSLDKNEKLVYIYDKDKDCVVVKVQEKISANKKLKTFTTGYKQLLSFNSTDVDKLKRLNFEVPECLKN